MCVGTLLIIHALFAELDSVVSDARKFILILDAKSLLHRSKFYFFIVSLEGHVCVDMMEIESSISL